MGSPPVRKPFFLEKYINNLYIGDNREKSFISIFLPAALMVLIALLIIIFAVVTYSATDASYKESAQGLRYCDDYYAAESVATEILAEFLENRNQQTSGTGNRSIYDSPQGEILVLKADNSISFTVPINKNERLTVMATATDGEIELIQWTIETD